MPEGHVIHRVAATLSELFGDQRLQVSSPQGRFSKGAELLDRGTLTDTAAHGKHMFVEFIHDDGTRHHLHVHLGLYGAWRFTTAPASTADPSDDHQPFEVPEPRGAVRLRLESDRAVADLNGPMTCAVLTHPEVDAVRARLGPDPLRDDSDPEAFVAAVRSSRRQIGELLMDQRVIAGIGNIYRVELLFRQRLHPAAPGHSVGVDDLRAVWNDAIALMTDGMRTGVILTTDPHERPDVATPQVWASAAERATPDETDLRWYVYRRTGRPCHRCGSPIASAEMAKRNVYWCPGCTPSPR